MSNPVRNVTTNFAASATARFTAIKATTTLKQWILGGLWGAACVAVGGIVLKYLAGDNVPLQYFGGLVIAYGINFASQGAFLHFALAVKDGILGWKNGTPEKPSQSEDAQS